MTLLKKIYSNLGEQHPDLSKYIEMIIKNNGDKNMPSRIKTKDSEPGLNEVDLVSKGVINRKVDDARLYMYEKHKRKGDGQINDTDKAQISQDFANLPGEKAQVLMRDKLRDASEQIPQISNPQNVAHIAPQDDQVVQRDRESMVALMITSRISTNQTVSRNLKP